MIQFSQGGFPSRRNHYLGTASGADNCAGVADVVGRFLVRNKFASGCVADLGPPSLLRKERNVSLRVLDCETDAASNSADLDVAF